MTGEELLLGRINQKLPLPGGESKPGLPRDRRDTNHYTTEESCAVRFGWQCVCVCVCVCGECAVTHYINRS